ncbi:MAG: hypothetical protein IJN04_00205 [Clostridia bacterium]|nr:hypothetical protein [Clostridia bacterium]
MNNGYSHDRVSIMARLMAGLGALGAAVTVLMRVWMPTSRLLTVCVMLAVLLALGGLVFLMRGGSRREITGKPSLTLAVVMLAAGAAMLLHGAAEALARLGIVTFYSVTTIPTISDGESAVLSIVLPWLQTAFSVLGGVALILAGLRVASEGGTRRGIAQASMLAPVLWAWLVLANYMMSYASMVRVTQGFFTLGMYVAEMLFLFRFACYLAGVGKNSVGSLLLFSAGAVTFVLSAPIVRLILYLLQEGAAYDVGAAGPLDLVVGVLALTVSVTLCQSPSAPVSAAVSDEEAPEWTGPSEDDVAAELIEDLPSDDRIEE